MRAYNLLFTAMFLTSFGAQAQLKNPEKQAEIQEKTRASVKHANKDNKAKSDKAHKANKHAIKAPLKPHKADKTTDKTTDKKSDKASDEKADKKADKKGADKGKNGKHSEKDNKKGSKKEGKKHNSTKADNKAKGAKSAKGDAKDKAESNKDIKNKEDKKPSLLLKPKAKTAAKADEAKSDKEAKQDAPKEAKEATEKAPAKVAKPLSPKEFREKALKQAQKLIQARLENIRNTANTTESADKRNIKGYVLSIYLKDFPDISPTINVEIKKTKASIKQLIKIIATDIEMHSQEGNKALSLQDDGSMAYTPDPELSKAQNAMRETLLKANLKDNISVRTAVVAIELLNDINHDLSKQAKKAKTRKEKEALYITQAIQVYELTDIVLDLLEKLQLSGADEIYKLYSDAKVAATDRIAEINTQIKRAYDLKEAGMMNAKQLKAEEESYEALKKTNVERLTVWDGLLDNITKQASFIEAVKKNKELLIYKRDKAKLQLTTLRDLRGVKLKNVIGSLSEVAQSVEKVELSTLDEKSIRSLLGYSEGL